MSVPLRVCCREIKETDIEAVIHLLERGFPNRGRAYWRRALDRLGAHAVPQGLPKFGHLLECNGAPVGVLLQICTLVPTDNRPTLRCDLSSFFVERGFRIYAPLLQKKASAYKDVTFVNISPARHTEPTIEAEGFSRYNNGQFVAIPALGPSRAVPKARIIDGCCIPDVQFDAAELELLRTHAAYGCISLWCISSERAFPFVFLPRLVKGFVPCTQLIYCRELESFVRFAQPIGRLLLKSMRPFVIIDATGPIAGLVGGFLKGRRLKYFKGRQHPHLGDLAYTELVMFGV